MSVSSKIITLRLRVTALTVGWMLVSGVSSVEAATYNWTGSGTTNWVTGTNWSPSGPPTAADDTIINTGTTGPTIGSVGAASSTLEVGTTSTGGAMLIQGGGSLADTSVYLGYNASSPGSAIVTGSGSNWTSSGNIVIGNSGTGSLTIQNGATVTDSTEVIAANAGSSGTVTVTGAGSSINNTCACGINIGQAGTGAVVISNGGLVTSTGGIHIGETLPIRFVANPMNR